MFCRLHIVQHPIATRWPISVLQNTRWQSTPGLVGQWGQFARSLISPTSRYTHIITQKKYQIKNAQIKKTNNTPSNKKKYIPSKKCLPPRSAPTPIEPQLTLHGISSNISNTDKTSHNLLLSAFQLTRGTLRTKRRKLLQSMHVLAKRVGDSKALYWSKTWATLIVYLVSLFSCLLDR